MICLRGNQFIDKILKIPLGKSQLNFLGGIGVLTMCLKNNLETNRDMG